MALITKSSGFVPPYFFDQLSRVDLTNKEVWKKCYQQSLQVCEERAQKSYPYDPVHLSSFNSRHYKITVITNHPNDPDVQSAMENAKKVMAFLKTKLGRTSFDGLGAALKVYLHDKDLDGNAQWSNGGSNGAVYIGDAIGRHTTLTQDIEIMAHEVAGHGVVAHTAKFKYKGQSGALRESWSDVIASMIKQYSKNQTAGESDWLVGDEYVKSLPEKIQALRSLKDPGSAYKFSELEKDPQVDHMNKYEDTDHRAVHIYSGIPNKAFYNFAMNFPDRFSWEVAGKIWYRALRSCGPDATFEKFARETIRAVDNVILTLGKSGVEIKQLLSSAWKNVGIKLPDIVPPVISIRELDDSKTPTVLYKEMTYSYFGRTVEEDPCCCLIQ